MTNTHVFVTPYPSRSSPRYRNESTKVSISKLIIGTKPKHLIWSTYSPNESITFKSVPKLFKIKSKRFGDFLKFKNETRTKPSYFIIGSKRFHKPRLQRKQNGTFANYFQIFSLVRNVFVCSNLLRNQNRTFFFF
jgi:hypothetical protein